jgi:hypothetical protein
VEALTDAQAHTRPALAMRPATAQAPPSPVHTAFPPQPSTGLLPPAHADRYRPQTQGAGVTEAFKVEKDPCKTIFGIGAYWGQGTLQLWPFILGAHEWDATTEEREQKWEEKRLAEFTLI